MLRYSELYGWLMVVWFLVACNLSSHALTSAQSSDSWGYTPAYSNSSNAVLNTQAPSCSFRSTSTYNSGVGSSAYAPIVSAPFDASAPNRARQWSPWDEEGDPNYDPIGVVPVGEPLCLLLMALLYVAFRVRHRLRSRSLT